MVARKAPNETAAAIVDFDESLPAIIAAIHGADHNARLASAGAFLKQRRRPVVSHIGAVSPEAAAPAPAKGEKLGWLPN